MGSKHQPTPDYSQAAKDQGAANLETAKTQSLLNNPNMVTPYGNQTYVMGPDGRPTLTQTLSPEEQAKYAEQSRAELSALGILNEDMPNIRDALSGPFGLAGSPLQGGYDPRSHVSDVQTQLDYSQVPDMPIADEAARREATDAMYREQARFLDPQFAQQEELLNSTLANQGIVRNPGEQNSAWTKEQGNFARQKMGAYGDARDRAVQEGLAALQTMFGMGMQSRQQGALEALQKGQFQQAGAGLEAQIAQALAQLEGNQRGQAYSEYSTNRTMPLNMLNALLSSSQINNPTFQATQPTSITPPPILQGAQLQGQANAANSSANAGLWGSGLGALGAALGGGSLGALIPLFTGRR